MMNINNQRYLQSHITLAAIPQANIQDAVLDAF